MNRPARYRGGGRFGVGWDSGSWAIRLAMLSGAISVALVFASHSQTALVAMEHAFVMQSDRVLHGEVWELATYALLENPLSRGSFDIIGLLLAVYMLWVFGLQIEQTVGPRTYVKYFFGFPLAGAVLTALLALVWAPAREASYEGVWVTLTALTVVYGRLAPDQPILMGFLIPVAGRYLVYLTLGILCLEAVASSPVYFIPHFGAFAAAALAMRGPNPRRWYTQLRAWQIERKLRKKARAFTVIHGEKDAPRDEPNRNGWLH